MPDFKGKLKKMKQNYEAVRDVASTMGAELPSGTYLMKRKGGELRERQDGTLYILTTWVVTEGEHQGKIHNTFDSINEEHLEYLHLYFLNHGVEPPEVNDIEEVLEALNCASIIVKMSIKRNKDGFLQYRIDEIVSSSVSNEPSEDKTVEITERDFVHFCGKVNIRIPKATQATGLEGMVQYVNEEFTIEASECDAETLSVLQSCGVEIEGIPESEPEPEPELPKEKKSKSKSKVSSKIDDEDLSVLRSIADNNCIAYDKNDTADSLAEILGDGFTWSKSSDDLTDEMVTALKNHGVSVKK